jgi:hypothetical protein
MKNLFHTITFISLIFLPGIAFSQFKISAELRPRFEMDNGTIRPRPDSVSTMYYVSQRTRIKFDLKREKYQLRLSLQDVRIWGDGDIYTSTGVLGSTGGVDIQEAWFRLKLGGHSQLTIGRQVLKLDGQRLIAGRNWNQFGLAYDALVYNLKKNGWDFALALSYNNNMSMNTGKVLVDGELFNHNNIIKTFNFLHLKRSFNKNLTASIIVIGAGYQQTDHPAVIYMTGTYGLWLKYDNGKFDLSTNAYFQNGTAQSGKDVFAYMLTLHPGITFQKIRIGLGGDYISGDNANDEDYGTKEKTFNRMYGAVFKYYGYMNYYSYMKASTANGGLVDIYPNISLSVGSKHTVTAFYHKFYLANPVLIGEAVIDNTDLGSEVDLMYTYKILTDLSLQAGCSYYFSTETLKEVKKVSAMEVNSPYWAWVMVTFSPELFSSNRE